MRRTRTLRSYALSLAALCAACGGDGDHPVPRTGRYHYLAAHTGPDQRDSLRLRGALLIEQAEPERIRGRWQVSRLRSDLIDGRWVDGAYEAEAIPTYEGRLVHRLVPGRDGSIACAGRYVLMLAGGTERSVAVRCELTLADTAAVALPPASLAPTVRPEP